MNSTRWELEARLLERVAQYRREYRSAREAALAEERERRHANGEVFFAGDWVPRSASEKIAQAFQRRELITLFEILLLLIFLIAVALGLCWAFAFLFLPA
jgi:hypothetical protein